MGIINMNEYIKEYYPYNFCNFSLKKYSNKSNSISNTLKFNH